MRTLMPEVEEALLSAVERGLGAGREGARRRRARRWRPTLAGVVTVASVLTTLAIAAIALTVLPHARTAAPLALPSAGGVRGLEQELAILRRPQTPADRLKLPAHDGVPPQLTRLAAVIDDPSLGSMHIYVALFHPVADTTQPAPPAIRFAHGVAAVALAYGPHVPASASASGDASSA